MHELALKVVESRDLWQLRLIELADTADQKVALDVICGTELGILTALCRGDLDDPFLGDIVPFGCLDGAVEADVGIEVVFRGDGDEIFEDLLLARVLARPVLFQVLLDSKAV